MAQILDLPIAITETENFYYIQITMNPDFTPSMLPDLFIPFPPENKRGVVIGSTGVEWLDTFLCIQYATEADWVALTINEDFATVVFSIIDKVTVGNLIEI